MAKKIKNKLKITSKLVNQKIFLQTYSAKINLKHKTIIKKILQKLSKIKTIYKILIYKFRVIIKIKKII